MGDTHLLPARVQNVFDMQIVRINVWTIKFSSNNIRLEGFIRSDDGSSMHRCCSEVICKRMTSTLLLDVTGRFFELVGQIDRNFQLKNGMPSTIVDEFMNGFPENWAFLIQKCIQSNKRMSMQLEIEAPPRSEQSTGTSKEPIVTLADETEMDGNTTTVTRKQVNSENVCNMPMDTRNDIMNGRTEQQEKEIDENEGDYTFRVPTSNNLGLVTPIRWEKNGSNGNQQKTRRVFEETPQMNGKSNDARAANSKNRNEPLMSSTPQPPASIFKKPRNILNPERDMPIEPVVAGVPEIPSPKAQSNTKSSYSSEVLENIAGLFDSVVVEKTPNTDRGRKGIPRKLATVEERRNASSPPSDRYNYNNYSHNDYSRYSSNQHRSQYDTSVMGHDTRGYSNKSGYGSEDSRRRGRDRSPRYDDLMGRSDRKRGYRSNSPEYMNEDYYRERKRMENERRYGRDFAHPRYDREYDDGRYERNMKSSKNVGSSSSSSRSVRFEEDQYHRHHHNQQHAYYAENQRGFDRPYDYSYDRKRHHKSRDNYEDEIRACERREKELQMELKKKQKEKTMRDAELSRRSSRKHTSSSSSENTDDELAREWERENQEILDASLIGSQPNKIKTKRSTNVKKEKERAEPKKPAPKAKAPRKQASPKKIISDLNESIATSRPRRACVTPASAPTVKKITWSKRDLDKLRRVIEMKKPSEDAMEKWGEVARLVAKDGCGGEECKQAAIGKLKMKFEKKNVEEEKRNEEKDDEDEMEKKRKGIAAAVKEDLKLREQMMAGNRKVDVLEGNDDVSTEVGPGDVSADESLLGIKTPVLITEPGRKKGGKRKSFVPVPIEDSPTRRSITVKSPDYEESGKNAENTSRYVQDLVQRRMKPSSKANNSYLFNKPSMSKAALKKIKNTSISIEEGAERAAKMIRKARKAEKDSDDEDSMMDSIREEDEEDASSDSS